MLADIFNRKVQGDVFLSTTWHHRRAALITKKMSYCRLFLTDDATLAYFFDNAQNAIEKIRLIDYLCDEVIYCMHLLV